MKRWVRLLSRRRHRGQVFLGAVKPTRLIPSSAKSAIPETEVRLSSLEEKVFGARAGSPWSLPARAKCGRSMRIIDLTLPMYTGMPVFPGDPEVSIETIQTFERDGWNMRRIEMNSHDGTHVNVPIHGTANGKTLDDYTLSDFCGSAEIY